MAAASVSPYLQIYLSSGRCLCSHISVSDYNLLNADEALKNETAVRIYDANKDSIQADEYMVNSELVLVQETPPQNNGKTPKAKADPPPPFTWTSEAVKLMLSLRTDKNIEFLRPRSKKGKLWDSIAAEMMKKHGYIVTGVICDAKFRNLTYRYKDIRNRLDRSGEGTLLDEDIGESEETLRQRATSTKWEFFESMDNLVGNKASVCPPPTTLGSSFKKRSALAPINHQGSQGSSSSSASGEGEENVAPEEGGENKRKKEKMSLQEYLFQKSLREEKKQSEMIRLEQERLRIESERNALIAKHLEALSKVAEK